jgi:hypothetical protein
MHRTFSAEIRGTLGSLMRLDEHAVGYDVDREGPVERLPDREAASDLHLASGGRVAVGAA